MPGVRWHEACQASEKSVQLVARCAGEVCMRVVSEWHDKEAVQEGRRGRGRQGEADRAWAHSSWWGPRLVGEGGVSVGFVGRCLLEHVGSWSVFGAGTFGSTNASKVC